MRGSFGPLTFRIMSGPTAASLKQSIKLPEHPRIESKGVLQWTGYELDTVKMSWRFDYIHGSPAAQLATLQEILVSHLPYPLITVSPVKGTIYGLPYSGSDRFENEYVLKSIDTAVKMTDHSGRLTVIDVNVSLIECIQDAGVAGLAMGGGGSFFGGLGGAIGGLIGGLFG